MKTNLFRLFFGCALALLACVSLATGQTVTGSITGCLLYTSRCV